MTTHPDNKDNPPNQEKQEPITDSSMSFCTAVQLIVGVSYQREQVRV